MSGGLWKECCGEASINAAEFPIQMLKYGFEGEDKAELWRKNYSETSFNAFEFPNQTLKYGFEWKKKLTPAVML